MWREFWFCNENKIKIEGVTVSVTIVGLISTEWKSHLQYRVENETTIVTLLRHVSRVEPINTQCSLLWVGIESTTCRAYSYTLVSLHHDCSIECPRAMNTYRGTGRR